MEGGRLLGEAEGGGDAAGSPLETQLAHPWPCFLPSREELCFTSGPSFCQQLEEEAREVQNYVDHVRALAEARDALAAEYERESEELRTKFAQLQLKLESQHKEVAELLALEGLTSIVHSSPSEQVAYLLVERSTLLERMIALEEELGGPLCLGRPCAAALQPPSEEVEGGNLGRGEAERGPAGAPDRLRSGQGEIPALNEEPDVSEGEPGKLCDSAGAEIWQGKGDQEAERDQQPVEPLAKPSLAGNPVSAPDPDSITAPERRQAREQKLPADTLLLEGLCFPEAERQAWLGGSGTSREAGSHLGGCFKHELHLSRAELLCLHGELQGFQGAAGERDFLRLAHQKLLQKNGLLEAKVSELSRECQHLNRHILRERKEEEEEEEERLLASRLSCPKFPARGQVCEDQKPSQGEDGEPACLHLSEASRMGEVVEPVQTKQEEEGAFLLVVQHQLTTHQERHGAVAQPCPPRAALGSTGGDTEQGPPHKGALQPQEEPPGLRGDPRQAPISGGSVKKQLRLEQERSLEPKLQNPQLQQENITIQAAVRLSGSPRASQGQLCRQTVEELQLELLPQCQAAKQQSRLREQLSQEGQRAAQAEKRVQELEQRLQEGQADLGRGQLEEAAREARAKEAEAWWSLQEELKRRKALEQQQEEQEQQRPRLWQEKEAGLLQALADQQAQAQQQEGQLRALEDEKRALTKEHLRCQRRSQRLSEQLSALRQEKETLCDEQRQMLKQVDVSLRKQSEQRLRHKARLRRAKETLLGEVNLRDTRIRNLENEVRLSKSQAEKDQLLIRRVTSENEGLARERRKMLEQLQSLEEAKQGDGQALRTLRSRVQVMEGENKQLQDQIVQLSMQVGILERALRTIHVHGLEELKGLAFPQGLLQRKLLPFPGFSVSLARLSDASSLRQAIKGGQPAEPGLKALHSPPASQGSRGGCLGVPGKPAGLRQDQPGHPAC